MEEKRFKQPVIISTKKEQLENKLHYTKNALKAWKEGRHGEEEKEENIKFFELYKKRIEKKLATEGRSS